MEYTTGVFQEIHWLKLIEYGPFFAWVTWHFFSGRTQRVPSYGSVGSVSVVIPAVNEGERIANCISSIKGQAYVAQIIVADGHSEDHTRAAARGLWGNGGHLSPRAGKANQNGHPRGAR